MADLQYPKAQAEEKLTALQKFFRKIKLALNNILDRIKNKRSGDLMITAEGKVISKDIAMVNDLLKKVRQGLVNVRTNYDAYVAGAEVKSAGDGKVRKMYGANNSFDADYIAAKVDTGIENLVNRVEQGDVKDNDNEYVGIVPDRAAEYIKSILGVD